MNFEFRHFLSKLVIRKYSYLTRKGTKVNDQFQFMFFSLCEYSGRDCGSWRVEEAQAMSEIEVYERVGGRRRRTHDEVYIYFFLRCLLSILFDWFGWLVEFLIWFLVGLVGWCDVVMAVVVLVLYG